MSGTDDGTKKLMNQVSELQQTNAELVERVSILERELVQAEQTSKVKSDYLESMSHDIRTAMNGIVGMTNLVLETELTGQQEQFLGMVNTSVDRLLEVVNEVLDFSKIEAGLLELDFHNFNLKESLDHDLYLLSLAAEQKGMTLTCDIDPDVPESINGDSRRLVQVLTNLVNNGIRYSERGGVSIKVQNDGYDRQNRVLLSFSVHDTGKGINLEKQKRIFNSFCHEDSFLAVSSDGAGIGLAICSQLVKQMGGEIGLASSGKGSVFWFTLPFVEAAEEDTLEDEDRLLASRQEESAAFALQGARVLLAEDEQINRVLTETILTQVGVEVTSVENGEQAVAEAASGDFQVILMDVQMPVLDGLEATARIRAAEKKKGKFVPIIALTALAMQGDREKCLQAGMDDYLAKPVDKDQLLDLLTKYLTHTALVAESDIESQQLLVRSLIESGWNVTIAESGRSVMYEVCLNNFDLILLDTDMDRMEGVEAAKVIRKLEDFSGRRALIVGIGEGGRESRQECVACGFDDYFQRPFSRDELQGVLARPEFE